MTFTPIPSIIFRKSIHARRIHPSREPEVNFHIVPTDLFPNTTNLMPNTTMRMRITILEECGLTSSKQIGLTVASDPHSHRVAIDLLIKNQCANSVASIFRAPRHSFVAGVSQSTPPPLVKHNTKHILNTILTHRYTQCLQ